VGGGSGETISTVVDVAGGVVVEGDAVVVVDCWEVEDTPDVVVGPSTVGVHATRARASARARRGIIDLVILGQ
jgi:hypothetical protein